MCEINSQVKKFLLLDFEQEETFEQPTHFYLKKSLTVKFGFPTYATS